MQIEFLGHAGYLVQIDQITILLDPWLVASSIDHPILNCFVPNHKTIDYLIPEPVKTVVQINPDVICLSHYHTHHAPYFEIDYWLKSSKKSITIIGPAIHEKYHKSFHSEFSKKYPNHRFLEFEHDQKYSIANELCSEKSEIVINMLTHTAKFHFAYEIKYLNRSFLHIADAFINRVAWDRRLDLVWGKFKDLNPDYLALSGGSVSIRLKSNHVKENSFMSPVEVANLTSIINPKYVSLMGIFNFSIWKNRLEYGFSAFENEGYFSWALRSLAPQVNFINARPGLILDLHNAKPVFYFNKNLNLLDSEPSSEWINK